jgi:hypothetical protein
VHQDLSSACSIESNHQFHVCGYRPLRTVPLPEKAQEQCIQAAEAIKSAYRAGVKRQCVQLLLPLIGATDLDDWPGGIRQQFKACQPMVEQILRSVKQVRVC